MSNVRYLELDSTYRNRNDWPIPGEFEVPIAQSGTKTRLTALDPISLATPIIEFNGSFVNNTDSATINVNIELMAPPIGVSGNPREFFVVGDMDELRPELNFYKGAVIVVDPGGATEVRRIIDKYEYISVDKAKIIVIDGIPDTVLVDGVLATITNPTDATALVGDRVFVPYTPIINNYLINCQIENIRLGETKTIIAFDGLLGIAQLDSPPAATWLPTDYYIIRKNSPMDTGTVTSGIFLSKVKDSLLLPATSITTGVTFSTPGLYNNIPTTTGGVGTGAILSIRTINPTTVSSVTVTSSGSGYLVGDTLTVAAGLLGINSTVLTFTLLADDFIVPTTTVVPLALTASSTNDIYVGGYLRIGVDTSGLAPDSIAPPEGETRRIVAYDGETKTVSVSPAFSVAPTTSNTYEVLGFSRDNFVPFTYTGSLVSQQESVCYEIELLNLVLPNQELRVGVGGRIAFYPYVYVELQNTSGSSAGTKNIIYSNNPNATRMLFRAAIDDINDPIRSPFIKIDSDGMKQTVKFKANDNLKFGVYLPNGQIFDTFDSEHYGPSPPNGLKQISALFSLRRLN